MTTSGTVARTELDVVTLIEQAALRCGILTSMLSAENLQTARQNLFMMLCNLTNRGINLWCVKHQAIPLEIGVSDYVLPAGTLEILQGTYTTGVYTAATTLASGVATLDYGSGNTAVVSYAEMTAALAGDYHLVLESSNDGVTWTVRATGQTQAAQVGTRLGLDSSSAPAARYWRLRETALVTTFTAANFTSVARDIDMAAMNRNDYESLPVKTYQTGSVLQYYYDRQVPNPVFIVWPTANVVGPHVTLTYSQQIQDVGALSNTLDVPTRYYLFIVHELATHMALTLPPKMVPEGRYPMLLAARDKYEREAADGDTSGGPIRIAPRIRGYTM